MNNNFNPNYSEDIEARIRTIEEALQRLFEQGNETREKVETPQVVLPVTFERVILDGDVTGVATQTVVEGIQGTPVDSTAPATGDLMQYDGTNWAPTDLNIPVTGVEIPIGGFGRTDISAINTTYEAINRAAGASGGQTRGIIMQRAGSVVGLSATGSGTVGGTSLKVKVRVYDTSGAAYLGTELELTLASGDQDGYVTQAAGVMAFDVGDRIEVWAERTGALNVRDFSFDPWVAL